MIQQGKGSAKGAACIRELLALIILATTLSACASRRRLPETEIVFQVYPADRDADDSLGFVDADGTDYTVLPRVMSNGILPVWSPDGTRVAYREVVSIWHSFAYGPHAVVGQRNRCSELGSTGRIRWMPDGDSLLATISVPKESGAYHNAAVSVDPETCAVLSELYSTDSPFGGMADAGISSSGLLAFGSRRIEPREVRLSIVVVDLNTLEEWIVGEGVVPSWSPSGEWLAYTGFDGIYVVRFDGTLGRRVLEYCTLCKSTPTGTQWIDWPPLPEWSPDEQWLVYHREDQGRYAIYKLNLETGEETLIAEQGLNPDWVARPAPQP